MHWRRKWQPTPVALPGESKGWGSLVAAIYGVAQSGTRLQEVRSRTLRFLPQLEMRPSSIEPNSVVSREAPPNTTVSLNSQRLPEILVVPREKTPTGAAARGNP